MIPPKFVAVSLFSLRTFTLTPMNLKKDIVFAVLLNSCCLVGTAQDTLKIMHYNLLHYGYPASDCTPKSVSVKNGYLKTIINYALPDIFEVNELYDDVAYADNILNNVMNTSS